jgi:hypothetical protein
MTAANAPSPNVVTANAEEAGAEGWRAFDHTDGSMWSTDQGWQEANPAIIIFDFGAGNAQTATSYTLTSGGDAGKSWVLAGSNNNTDWTALDTRTVVTFQDWEMRTFTISSPGSYRYYRIRATRYDSYGGFMEIELIGTPASPASHSYEETIEDGFDFSDTLGDIFYDGIEDGLDIQETVSTWLVDIIAEGFILSDDSKLDWIKTIEDSFFAYCDAIPAWHLVVLESLISADALKEIIGQIADEYLLLEGVPISSVKVQHILNDMVFGFDDSDVERYYLLLAEDTIDFGDVLQEILGNLIYEILSLAGVSVAGLLGYRSIEDTINAGDASVSERYYLLLADETVDMTDGEVTFLSLDLTAAETFNASDTAAPVASFGALASESLVFTDIDSFIQELIIEEGLDFGDVELTRWVFNVLIATGFDIAEAFD